MRGGFRTGTSTVHANQARLSGDGGNESSNGPKTRQCGRQRPRGCGATADTICPFAARLAGTASGFDPGMAGRKRPGVACDMGTVSGAPGRRRFSRRSADCRSGRAVAAAQGHLSALRGSGFGKSGSCFAGMLRCCRSCGTWRRRPDRPAFRTGGRPGRRNAANRAGSPRREAADDSGQSHARGAGGFVHGLRVGTVVSNKAYRRGQRDRNARPVTNRDRSGVMIWTRLAFPVRMRLRIMHGSPHGWTADNIREPPAARTVPARSRHARGRHLRGSHRER